MSEDTAAIMATLQAYNPVEVIAYATLTIKMVAIALVKVAAVTLLMAIVRMVLRSAKSAGLRIFGYIGLGLGALGALYSLVNTGIAMKNSGVTRLAIILPSLLEALTLLAMGLIVWLIALAGNAGARKPA